MRRECKLQDLRADLPFSLLEMFGWGLAIVLVSTVLVWALVHGWW